MYISAMDQHLNLFRFFNESDRPVFIENNLSRAFALCLSNNSFLLNEYIQDIVTPEHYEYLFGSLNKDTRYEIDLQVETTGIETENYNTVYAVAMTTEKDVDMSNFFEQKHIPDKKNKTDIFISIKDIAIVIEVKRTGENCVEQLFNQVLPFKNSKHQPTILPKCYSWQHVIKIMERVKHVQSLANQDSVFLSDFMELSESRYPDWFEPKPFYTIEFSSKEGSPNEVQLTQRMRQALTGVADVLGKGYELLTYRDRVGIKVPFNWASELIPHFENDTNKTVAFYIWPGNTNQQGSRVYDKRLDWLSKKEIQISEQLYPLRIMYNVKLTHFNKYVTDFSYTNDDVVKPLHTKENYQQAGKWESKYWSDFEKWMDDHIKTKFNWREKCDWDKKFRKTDRTYLTVSLGFEVATLIPYKVFQQLDKKNADIDKVTSVVIDIAKAYSTLLSESK
jgi:hypothetical protein